MPVVISPRNNQHYQLETRKTVVSVLTQQGTGLHYFLSEILISLKNERSAIHAFLCMTENFACTQCIRQISELLRWQKRAVDSLGDSNAEQLKSLPAHVTGRPNSGYSFLNVHVTPGNERNSSDTPCSEPLQGLVTFLFWSIFLRHRKS